MMTAQSSALGEKKSRPKFDANGNLMLPEGYRTWVYVGSTVTPNDMNHGKAPFPEFHIVYIDPASFAEFKRTGKFRQGTIFVKELVSVGGKQAPSGNGYFPGKFLGVAASVKDVKRFSEEPGNWGFFDFTAGPGKPYKKKSPAFPTSACSTCHSKEAQDYVFIQYYPVLQAVKPE
jgi:hypothetical protein